MPGTILLGIDVESANESSAGYALYAANMYRELNAPVTWYLTGRTLERYPAEFKAIEGDPIIELQSHTYSHMLLKTVLIQVPKGRVVHGKKDWVLVPGGSLQEIDADLTKCQQVFQDVLGRKSSAMTTPWGYYRGLGDRLDLLELLRKHGFRAIRCFARNEYDGQPVPMEWQPFFYKVQGYPEILEALVHDYQDDFYWEQFGRNSADETYEEHLRRMARRVAREDLVWSMASHDHGCSTKEGFEKKGQWLRDLITYAQDLGIRFMKISDYYQEKLVSRDMDKA